MASFHFEYDVALSYSFAYGDDQHLRLTNQIIAALQTAGLTVFWIPESNVEMSNRWKRRYFEGLFRSRYLVPVLSDRYLRGEGSREEMEEISRLVQRRRFETFFYPLVPIAMSVEHLRAEAMQHVGERSAHEWLRTHAFPVYLAWGTEAVGAFFRSLVQGAKGEPNLAWLRQLAPHITYVNFIERFGHPTTQVQIKNPLFKHNYEFHVGREGVRYAGCIFEPAQSKHDIEPPVVVDQIEKHLSAEIHPREPGPGEEMMCDNCRRLAFPASYRIGAECPHCGDQMSEKGGEAARRQFLRRFGKGG